MLPPKEFKQAKPKRIKDKKCKNCPNKFTPHKPLQIVCSPKCAIEWNRKLTDKKEKLKTYDIKKMSDKAKKENAKYLKLRLEYLGTHATCKASLIDCTFKSTEIHHKAKRGVNLNNTDTWIPVCRTCHIQIEEMPFEEALEKGLRCRR